MLIFYANGSARCRAVRDSGRRRAIPKRPLRAAHNGVMRAHSILRIFACLVCFAAALPTLAQSVTPVLGSHMLFSDPAFGVSFRFPSGWSFTRVNANANGPALAIAYMDGRSVATGLRGLVTNETLPGLRSWPRTVFSGVEFAYDARPADSAEACHRLARGNWEAEADPVTLNGVTYWHGTASSGGASTAIDEEIYATFVPSSGSCLRFDLAVATSRVPGRDLPRELTTHEMALIRTSLDNILHSIRIAPPAR